MATRPKGYGFTSEIAGKIASKYDEDRARVAADWIKTLTGFTASGASSEEMQEWLSDGFVLCSLMNALKPNAIPKFKQEKMAFKKMETISKFLTAAGAYGLRKEDIFQTVDLFEGQNMPQVISTIYSLSSQSTKHNFNGPIIGVKVADENKRDLDEQKLREGRNVSSLQMGTNQVASQKGMTPYGLGRQLTPQSQ